MRDANPASLYFLLLPLPRRDARKVRPGVAEMFGQRVFGIACGYEDGNDFDELRHDPALKVAVGRLPRSGHDLASQPTLSRLENSVGARAVSDERGVGGAVPRGARRTPGRDYACTSKFGPPKGSKGP